MDEDRTCVWRAGALRGGRRSTATRCPDEPVRCCVGWLVDAHEPCELFGREQAMRFPAGQDARRGSGQLVEECIRPMDVLGKGQRPLFATAELVLIDDARVSVLTEGRITA